MNNATIKLIAAPYKTTGGWWIFRSRAELYAFAQACCDWQKDKDARVCDYIAASHLEFVGDAADCADAIRNAKENPESDIERATNLR